jgi:predicted nucleotidyltransferase
LNDRWRRETEKVGEELVSTLPEVQALRLFGSLARRDAQPASDIDLLVVTSAPMRGRDVRRILPPGLGRRMSLTTHTWESLARQKHTDWSFLVHLSEDGEPLYDPGDRFYAALHVKYPDETDFKSQLSAEDTFLRRFDDLDRYGGDFSLPLAQLFSVAKYVCMLDNTAHGYIAFQRDRAFEVFARRHPESGRHIAAMRSLWPFLAARQGRAGPSLPFSPLGAQEEVLHALWATRHLVHSAGQ